MLAFARAVGAFFLMMTLGYLAMVVLLPAPATLGRPDELITGRSAAVRLSDEARALAAHKPVEMPQ